MALNTTNKPFHFSIASDPLGQYILLTVFILQQVLGNALFMGLLWYERHGQDIKRTLYNQVFHMSFGYVLLTNVSIQIIEFTILYFSPGFPEWFCWIKDLAVKFSLIYGSLFAVQLSILKYCYVVLWKRVVGMDDDFLATFLLTLNVTLGLLGALLDHYWNGPHSPAMCLCMDVDWSNYYPFRFSDRTSGEVVFAFICVLIEMGIFIRINIDNLISNSRRNAVTPLERSLLEKLSLESCFEKLQGVYGFRAKGAIISLGMSSLTHWTFFACIIPLALFPRFYEYDPGALNKFPLSLYYILAYVAPILFLYVFVPLVYYWKHPHILKTILNNLYDDLQEINCC